MTKQSTDKRLRYAAMNAVEERGLWVTDECEEWEERDSNSFEIDI
jgi:hypothetical protein